MKNVIKITLMFAFILACITPAQISQARANKEVVAKRTMVDFMSYNISSSSGYVWLRNKVTDETYYFSFTANTGDTPVKIGEIPASDDPYEATVMLSNGTQNIQLYYAYEYNTSYLYADDLNLACGSCAMVRIGYNN